MIAHEKGRGDHVARPLVLFPYPFAACQSGITCQCPDGDTQNVSRVEAQCKPAVADFPGDGHEHLTCHG
jgi:hypothetical protein